MKRKKQNELILRDSLKALSSLLRTSEGMPKVIEVQIGVTLEDGDMICLSIEKIEGQKELEKSFEHRQNPLNEEPDTPPLLN
tara:strand:+ start:535 stop:780 length:246 start_codon:yes stop_codon:yes gene_type:complete